MLFGGSTLSRTKLSGQLLSQNQAPEIFTPQTAVEAAGHEGVTFLLGMDGSQADDAHAERLLRTDLHRHNISYQVLYGTSEECLAQALQTIQRRLPTQSFGEDSAPKAPADQTSSQNAKWVWACDKCSDPLCEHRLLSSLLASRKSRTTEPLP
jgi:hypothetical protein